MSRSLNSCRHIPGWIKPFLAATKNGYNEKNAANMAGVGTNMIRQRMESDPEFKRDYEHTCATKKPRYGHGAW